MERWFSPKAHRLLHCPRCGHELSVVAESAKWREHLQCPSCFGVYTMVKTPRRCAGKCGVKSSELHLTLDLEEGREAAEK